MRRTTICRSSVILAAAVAVSVGAAAAQEPAPPAPAAAVPATHTVVEGETLWALAQRYLGDPMLWPEIYRLNTDVVEDPHWIFPGEVLRLRAGEAAEQPAAQAAPVVEQGVAAAPAAEPAQQAGAAGSPAVGPTIFSRQAVAAAPVSNREEIERRSAQSYRAVREGEYFSAGFLTEGQELPAATIATIYQTSVVQANIRTRDAALPYEDVLLAGLPAGDSLVPGDLLLAFRYGGAVEGFGRMVLPTGLLRMRGYEGPAPRATVVRMFHQVMRDQHVIKVAPFAFNSNQRPQPVTDGVEGRVIALRNEGAAATKVQDVLFIDRGADDGIRLGDLLTIFIRSSEPVQGTAVDVPQGRAIVVSTRARTSTAVIIHLDRANVGTESLVRQVARMPS